MNTFTQHRRIVVYPCLEMEQANVLYDTDGVPVFFKTGTDIKLEAAGDEQFFETEKEAAAYMERMKDEYEQRAEAVKKELAALVNSEYFSIEELLPQRRHLTGWRDFYAQPYCSCLHTRMKALSEGVLLVDSAQYIRLSTINRVVFRGKGTADIHTTNGILTVGDSDAQFLRLLF